jgi:hypothetical protein
LLFQDTVFSPLRSKEEGLFRGNKIEIKGAARTRVGAVLLIENGAEMSAIKYPNESLSLPGIAGKIIDRALNHSSSKKKPRAVATKRPG